MSGSILKRAALFSATVAVAATLSAQSTYAQVNGTWNVNADGSWGTAGNWSGGVPGSGGTATFGSPPATATRTVTLNVSPSIAGITLNGTNRYIINGSGSNSLTLVAPRTITVSAGTHEINAPIAGTAGLTKNGAGILQLGGSNTLVGNTAVNAGVLRLTSSNNLGPAGSNNQLGMAFGGAVELASAGTIDLGNRNVAFASSIAQAPGGALVLSSGSASSSGQWFFLSGSSVTTATGLTLTHTGDILDSSSGGGLTKLGAGTLSVRRLGGVSVPSGATTVQQPLSKLSVNAGSVLVNDSATGNGRTGRINDLSISAGATLNLNRSSLVWDYAGASPIATLRGHLQTGRITSTVTGGVYGYAESSTLPGFSGDFAGQTGIDATALLVRPTLAGDSTLDGTVNFDDLLRLASSYNNQGNWANGDYNYDGNVNFDDLLLLAANYNSTFAGGAAGAGAWSLAVAAVPEPTSAAMVGAFSILALRRTTSSSR
jgi:autotransporter-associated beta strand protein